MFQSCNIYNYSKVVLATAITILGLGSVNAQQLEEVIVTAQKREENLQDVPVAVSAYSGDFLSENSIKDVTELMVSTPSLFIGTNQSASTGNFSIRGIGTGAQNFGLESSVGLYVDGVYRSRQSSMINQLIDLEAVEVLRGPQGTLFGRNSASGAVLFRTVAPSHDQDGFLELSMGDYNLTNISGAFNLSLSDNVASRTTFFSSSRDGFIDVIDQDKDLNNRNRRGLRQQFLYTPSDTLSARLIVDYAKLDELCCASLTLQDSLYATGRLSDAGGPVYGTDAILTQMGGTVFPSSTFGNRQQGTNVMPTSSATDSGISLEISKDLGDHTFTSITAVRKFDTADGIDADFTNVALATRNALANQKGISQEFRFVSNADSRVRYQVGTYFFSQDIESNDHLTLDTMLPAYVVAASPDVLGTLIDTLSPQLIGFINGAYGTSLGYTLASPINAGNIIQDHSEQSHDSSAIFGEIDFDISDTLTLNMGVRFTSDKKDMVSTFNESIATPGATALNVTAITAALGIAGNQALAYAGQDYDATYAAMNAAPYLPALQTLYAPGWAQCTVSARFCPRAGLDESFDKKRTTGNVGLSYAPNDTRLFYISHGTGYKSGGTNTDRIGLGFDATFGPEDTTTTEIGMKLDFPQQAVRLNVALYDMLVENLQTNTFTGTAFNLQNAGEAQVNGLEAEVYWMPTDTTSLSLIYTRTDATFENFEKGNCQLSNIFHTGNASEYAQNEELGYCDRSGDSISNVPDDFLSINAAKTFVFGSGYNVTLGMEYISYPEMLMNNTNDPFSLQGANDLLNLRMISRMTNGVEAILWARNVNDTMWHGTSFDTPLQDGKQGAYPFEPRTVGLTFRKNF
jgi:iron complex outermembrane recepter protein